MKDDLSDDLIALEIVYSGIPGKQGRAMRWAYRVIRRSGYGPAVRRLLASYPHHRRWWVLRQFLPDEAIGRLAELINRE